MLANRDLIHRYNESIDSHIAELRVIRALMDSEDPDSIAWMKDEIWSALHRINESIGEMQDAIRHMRVE